MPLGKHHREADYSRNGGHIEVVDDETLRIWSDSCGYNRGREISVEEFRARFEKGDGLFRWGSGHVSLEGTFIRHDTWRELAEKIGLEQVPHIHATDGAGRYGCTIPLDANFTIKPHGDDALVMYFNEADNVSDLHGWDANSGEPHERGFYFDPTGEGTLEILE